MTLEQLTPLFAVLAVQCLASDVDEATISAYLPVLEPYDVELVEEAARRLGRSVDANGKTWFPRAAEWRVEIAKVEHEWRETQRALLRRLPEPLCQRCRDTSWKRMSTGRVRPCECRYERRQELLGRVPLPKQLTGAHE